MSNSFKKGDWDTVYKKLMVLKLLKELWRDIFPSTEEFDACKNMLLKSLRDMLDSHKNID